MSIFFLEMPLIWRAEPLHDCLGSLRPDAFDEATAQIGNKPSLIRWNHGFALLHGELRAILRLHPTPIQVHFNGIGIRQVEAHSNKVDAVATGPARFPGCLRD